MRYLGINLKIYVQDLYETIIKTIRQKETNNCINKRFSMYMDTKPQICLDVSSSKIKLQIQCKSNQIFSKWQCGYWQIHYKVYMDRQKTENSQHNTEGEEQSRKTGNMNLQDLL